MIELHQEVIDLGKQRVMTGELMDLLVILVHRPNKACCVRGMADRSVKSALERGWIVKENTGEWEQVRLLPVGERSFVTYQHFLTTDQREMLAEAFQHPNIRAVTGMPFRTAEQLVARGFLRPTVSGEGGTHAITGSGRELMGLKPE